MQAELFPQIAIGLGEVAGVRAGHDEHGGGVALVMLEGEMSAFKVDEEVGEDEDRQDGHAEQGKDKDEIRLLRVDLFDVHKRF
jgi:hypothetical protein